MQQVHLFLDSSIWPSGT